MSRIALSVCLVIATLGLLVGCGGSGGSTPTPSTDANLSALVPSHGTLTPGFVPGTIAYAVAVSALETSVTITPTTAEASATVMVDGTPVGSGSASSAIPLAAGPNPVLIAVTAADGTTIKIYTVVFTRAATAAQEAYIKASNTETGDLFGHSMALSGGTLVVGAVFEGSNATGVNGNQADNSESNSGAAYVFVRTGNTWTQQAYVKASNTEAGDQFGYSVAIDGDTIVVGAYSEGSNATGVNGNQADNSANSAGAAYVFVRSGTTWTQQAYLKASNTEANDSFGWSVSVAGDTVAVSALTEDSNTTGVNNNQADNSTASSGAVYVFLRTGTSWVQQAYIKASNTEANDFFGYSVGLSGNTLVVGAVTEGSNATGVNGNEPDNSASNAGAAYVFTRTANVWTQQAYLKASNTEIGDLFGIAVAISDDTVVVSARDEDSNATGMNGNQADNSAVNSGAAYVFVRSGTTWTQQAYLKASNTESFDFFGGGNAVGEGVEISGDVIVVCATGEDSNTTGIGGNQADNSALSSGAAYVFVRSGTTWTQQAYVKASNMEAGDEFGYSAALSGGTAVMGARIEDSNATGIGGNQADNSATNSGAAYVIR